jgi:hypothetical protein
MIIILSSFNETLNFIDTGKLSKVICHTKLKIVCIWN